MGLEVVLPSGNKYKIGLDEILRIGRVPTDDPEVLKEEFKVKDLPQMIEGNLMICIENEKGKIKECYIEEELYDFSVSRIDPGIGKYGSVVISGSINKINIKVPPTAKTEVKLYTVSSGETIIRPGEKYETKDKSVALVVGCTLIYVYRKPQIYVYKKL